MKKLVSLWLTLCMLCGAWMVVGAEETPTQTCNTQHYSYDLPADWILTFDDAWEDGPIAFSDTSWEVNEPIHCWIDEASGLFYTYVLCNPDISIRHTEGHWLSWDTGLSSLKEYSQYMGSPFSDYDIPLNEKSMPGGVKMAYGSANGRVAYLWCDGSLMASFTAEYNGEDIGDVSNAQIEDDLYNRVVLPFFQSLRPVGTEITAVTPVQDVAVAGKQVFRISDATFQVDPDLVVEQQNEMVILASNDRYQLQLVYIDWAVYGINVHLTGDIQYDNLVFYWLLNGLNVTEAMSITDNASDMTCDMPDGNIVKMIAIDAGVMLAHYYDDKCVVMILMAKDSEAKSELIMTGADVMQSFRVDGVTEEDMRTAAEATAEAAAAAKAEAEVQAAMTKYVVITADSGKIRTEASISGGLLKTAYKGEAFPLQNESGDWYIVDVDGRTGYIHKGVAAIQ